MTVEDDEDDEDDEDVDEDCDDAFPSAAVCPADDDDDICVLPGCEIDDDDVVDDGDRGSGCGCAGVVGGGAFLGSYLLHR